MECAYRGFRIDGTIPKFGGFGSPTKRHLKGIAPSTLNPLYEENAFPNTGRLNLKRLGTSGLLPSCTQVAGPWLLTVYLLYR